MTVIVYITRHRQFRRIKKIYTTPPTPQFVAFVRPRRPKIKRGRRFLRRVYPFLPSAPLLFAPRKRFKIRRRVLRMGPKRYSIAGPPVGFIAYKRPPRPRIKRAKRFSRKLLPFLPKGPLIWQRPRFLRPKIRRRRQFVLRHPYTTPPAPVSFIAWRPFKRTKVRRSKISLQRFKLRYYEFPGTAPIKKIVDWLVRARRRGRR